MQLKHTMKTFSGFTLIEVLIVLSMVSILASLAYTSYSGSLEKSRRADAKRALLGAAGEQERWYLRENVYTPLMDDIGGDESPDGHYTLVAVNSIDGNACADQLCFTITATATVGGLQAGDDDCQRFTIDNLGRRRAYDSGAVENEDCW